MDKILELLEIYKDDVAELKSKRGTGFPIKEARQDTEIAYKEMFIKDLERAINLPKQPQKYCWRLKLKSLKGSYYIVDEYATYFDTVDESEALYLTTREAKELLKDDFDMFEKVEVN